MGSIPFKLRIICCAVLVTCCVVSCTKLVEVSDSASAAPERPNIVLIYVDDLGYGDVGAYGAVGVETPNVDRIARDGLRFTDAHAAAATCTPSRYSLLTGEYGFRNSARVLRGDAPALIQPGKATLPTMLKKAGYTTGVVGKWHLGLGNGSIDWNGDVKPGPLEIGFDYSFLLPATGDRVPTVYLENHRVVDLDPKDPIEVNYTKKVGDRPTGEEHPDLLRYAADGGHSKTIVNGISRIGYMAGGESALWVDEEFPDILTDKALSFIRKHSDKPFFLFHSFHDIHVPRLPNERFLGKSEMGWRGDAIVQMDWMTGQIVDELEALGLAEKTIIIFTSDNGPILNDGYADDAVERLGNHKPAGPLRGSKYSIYEGGTRVPTVIYWPGRIEPGESAALVSQVDIYASLANLLGAELTADEAIDSENLLPALLGESVTGREFLFSESAAGVSLRKGSMKFIPALTEGARVPKFLSRKGIDSGAMSIDQVYDLSVDVGEINNVAEEHNEFVLEMKTLLDTILNTQEDGDSS